MKGRCGFTLIELLVVLSILGVLVALVVPRFTGLAAKKKRGVCLASLRIMDSAIAIYRIEEGEWPATLTSISDGVTGYLWGIPPCPGGGRYKIARDKERSLCSIHRRGFLKPYEAVPYPISP